MLSHDPLRKPIMLDAEWLGQLYGANPLQGGVIPRLPTVTADLEAVVMADVDRVGILTVEGDRMEIGGVEAVQRFAVGAIYRIPSREDPRGDGNDDNCQHDTYDADHTSASLLCLATGLQAPIARAVVFLNVHLSTRKCNVISLIGALLTATDIHANQRDVFHPDTRHFGYLAELHDGRHVAIPLPIIDRHVRDTERASWLILRPTPLFAQLPDRLHDRLHVTGECAGCATGVPAAVAERIDLVVTHRVILSLPKDLHSQLLIEIGSHLRRSFDSTTFRSA